MSHGSFSIARHVLVPDRAAEALLRRIHDHANQMVEREGERFRWLVKATEHWLEFKEAYGESLYRLDLGNWLIDEERIHTFLKEVDRACESEPSIGGQVADNLRMLFRAK